ncbi:MAG: hypothetical protein QNI84_15630 [Henriciella sp.]|nr:hypothetical protein [Henriciella sp.]
MFKTIFTASACALCFATAQAGQNIPPPPPTEVYIAPAVTVCDPVSVQIYFRNGEVVLSEFSRTTLSATRERLDGCKIASVSLVSETADGRTAKENASLADARAQLVLSALDDKGLMADEISTELNIRSDKATARRPIARRVDVTLAAYRPDIG